MNTSKCDENICIYSTSFEYQLGKECTLRIVCNKLSENACSTFGLVFGDQKVCLINRIYEDVLKKTEPKQFEIWYSLNELSKDFEYNCIVWCEDSEAMISNQTLSSDEINNFKNLKVLRTYNRI